MSNLLPISSCEEEIQEILLSAGWKIRNYTLSLAAEKYKFLIKQIGEGKKYFLIANFSQNLDLSFSKSDFWAETNEDELAKDLSISSLELEKMILEKWMSEAKSVFINVLGEDIKFEIVPINFRPPFGHPEPEPKRFSSFIRDPFLVLGEKGIAKKIVESNDFRGNSIGQALLADRVAAGLKIPLDWSAFEFMGGNFHYYSDCLVIGVQAIYNFMEKYMQFASYAEARNSLLTEIEKSFNVSNVFWLGESTIPDKENPPNLKGQPFVHIDTYFTPLGKNREGEQLCCLGHVRILNEEYKNIAKELNDLLELIEIELLNREFKVIRLPIFITAPSGSFDSIFSYCNLLVENIKGGIKIFLPLFGDKYEYLRVFDDLALCALKDFSVQGVHGIGDYNTQQGSLRCITKELNRGTMS